MVPGSTPWPLAALACALALIPAASAGTVLEAEFFVEGGRAGGTVVVLEDHGIEREARLPAASVESTTVAFDPSELSLPAVHASVPVGELLAGPLRAAAAELGERPAVTAPDCGFLSGDDGLCRPANPAFSGGPNGGGSFVYELCSGGGCPAVSCSAYGRNCYLSIDPWGAAANLLVLLAGHVEQKVPTATFQAHADMAARHLEPLTVTVGVPEFPSLLGVRATTPALAVTIPASLRIEESVTLADSPTAAMPVARATVPGSASAPSKSAGHGLHPSVLQSGRALPADMDAAVRTESLAPAQAGASTAASGAVAPAAEDEVPLLVVVGAVAAALLLGLYHRIHAARALDHSARAAIHRRLAGRHVVVANQLARELGVNRTTVVFHLRTMQREGLVRPIRRGRAVAWVPAYGGTPTIGNADVSPTARRVRQAVEAEPDGCLADYARTLGLSVSHAHYHLRRLVASGELAERVEAGRRRYAPCQAHLQGSAQSA